MSLFVSLPRLALWTRLYVRATPRGAVGDGQRRFAMDKGQRTTRLCLHRRNSGRSAECCGLRRPRQGSRNAKAIQVRRLPTDRGHSSRFWLCRSLSVSSHSVFENGRGLAVSRQRQGGGSFGSESAKPTMSSTAYAESGDRDRPCLTSMRRFASIRQR